MLETLAPVATFAPRLLGDAPQSVDEHLPSAVQVTDATAACGDHLMDGRRGVEVVQLDVVGRGAHEHVDEPAGVGMRDELVDPLAHGTPRRRPLRERSRARHGAGQLELGAGTDEPGTQCGRRRAGEEVDAAAQRSVRPRQIG